MCEWSDTHRHIHPKIHKHITKIIIGRNILGDDVNPRENTRHELNLIFGGWILGYPVTPKI